MFGKCFMLPCWTVGIVGLTRGTIGVLSRESPENVLVPFVGAMAFFLAAITYKVITK